MAKWKSVTELPSIALSESRPPSHFLDRLCRVVRGAANNPSNISSIAKVRPRFTSKLTNNRRRTISAGHSLGRSCESQSFSPGSTPSHPLSLSPPLLHHALHLQLVVIVTTTATAAVAAFDSRRAFHFSARDYPRTA